MTQEIITQISSTVGTEVFGIWFLIGAAFVFFMQAGFAMVETGFTRAKNAGNIIMKNLMDFCIGTIVFIFLGFGLLLGEDALGGLVGVPTLGRYEFDSNTGALKSNTPAQVASVENCTQEVVISNSCKELSVFRAGNTATDSTAQNATARNLKEFISTTLSNGGYYIARFEASGTASKITSKYNQKVLVDITQPNAAKLAREMYEEVKENNELVYASDLVNSYAWDTAIVFIQTYSVKTDYASHNESNTTKAFTATGKNNDKYCNIFDMSGNASEWTTEYSTDSYIINSPPCVIRGGCYNPANGSGHYTSYRSGSNPTSSYSNTGLRPLLYVK